jgi:hypothetical protein
MGCERNKVTSKTTLFMEENGFVYKPKPDFFVKHIWHDGNRYLLHIGFYHRSELYFSVSANIYSGRLLVISKHKTSYCLEIEDYELYYLLFKYMVRDADKLIKIVFKVKDRAYIYYYSHKECEFAFSQSK